MQHKLPVIAVNGVIDQQVSPLDRGFTYGDGVFETCRMLNAKIPLWNLHVERLITSCKKLAIPVTRNLVQDFLTQLLSQIAPENLVSAVIKIIVTRGQGGRGYGIPNAMQPTICIGVFPAGNYSECNYSQGVSVRICAQRLGCNSTLAGLKHLNRLENVLARAEWDDERFSEGLMFDISNNLIEATMSNIFIVNNGDLYTPDLNEAGVAGVMRRLIIDELAPQLKMFVNVKKISHADLISADEIFLCNSIFGIWPVIDVFDQQDNLFVIGKITTALQKLLANRLA
ncbi:MAG: aminodeoxychorismate lyase [Pseudomonadota bacterium]